MLSSLVRLPCWQSSEADDQGSAGGPRALPKECNGSEGPGGFLIGGRVSAVGRWTTISVLSALLVGSEARERQGIRRQALKALGAVVPNALPQDVDVLLVHNLPARLVKCATDAPADEALQIPALAVTCLASLVHPLGIQWHQVRKFPVLAALTHPFEGSGHSPRSDGGGDDGDAGEVGSATTLEEQEESLGWRDKQLLEARRDLRARVLQATAAALLETRQDQPVLAAFCRMTAAELSAATGAAVPPSPSGGAPRGLGSACLRVLLHVARESAEAARVVASCESLLNSRTTNGDGFTQGLTMLLMAALLMQGELSVRHATRVVQAAALCLAEAQDIRVSAAAASVLSAALDEARRRSEATPADDAPEWKALAEFVLRSVASSATLAGVRRLLCFQSPAWVELVRARRQRAEAGPSAQDGESSADELGVVHLEGSEFGGRVCGLLDHVSHLLSDTITLFPAVAPSFLSGRLCQPLFRQLFHGGHGELSPRGLVSSLRLVRGLMEHGPSADLYELALSEGVLGLASACLHPPHLRDLKRWPLEHGGGVRGITELLTAVATVVRVPLPPQSCPRATLVKWQQALFDDGLINGTLVSLRAVAKRIDTPPPLPPIDLLSRLVLLSSNFLQQFMTLQGLSTLRDADAFSAASPPKVIVNSLLIACQAARASEVRIPPDLWS